MSRHIKSNTYAVLLLATLFLSAGAYAPPAVDRIIALAGEVNGRIAALDNQGAVWIIPANAVRLSEARLIGKLPAVLSPVSLTLFSLDKADYVAANGTGPRTGVVPTMVLLFDVAGADKPLQYLTFRWGGFTGIVYDPPARRALIADPANSEIYEAAPVLSAKYAIRQVRSIPALKSIGPLALDDSAKRLYCADPVQGFVYALDLQTRQYRLVVQKAGEINALCLNRARTILYAADSARHRLWAIQLGPSPTILPFATALRFHEPTGLAMDAGGNLWISDSDTRTISVVTSSGQLVRQLH